MQPIHIGTRRELFVDDYLIDQMRDVRLDLKKPERREIAFQFDSPWEDNTAFATSLITDGTALRLYYRASIPDRSNERLIVFAMAESADGGFSFIRNNRELCPFKGSTANNIIAIGELTGPAVFLDTNPRVNPAERYKGLFPVTKGPRHAWRLYAICSSDGLRWRLMQEPPLDYPGAFDSINTSFWDSIAGCYRSFTREFVGRKNPVGGLQPEVRIIQSATSPDYIHWTKPIPNEYVDGETEVQLYTNSTLPCPGAQHIYVAFPNRFMEWRRVGGVGPQGCNDALFMASRDGIHWTRYLDAWVRPGNDPRNWGQRNNYPLWGIAQTSATEWSMYISEHYMQPDVPGRMRRLAIRPHGFVAVHADYRGGEFITKPIVFDGHCLRLNYSTSAAGQIQIELQDVQGRPLEGFRRDDMDPLFGDELDGGITWKRGSDLAALIGTPVRLRFVMNDADVFAFRFTSDDQSVSRSYIIPYPIYQWHAQHSEMRIRPVSRTITIDGNLADWDLSGALTMWPADWIKDQCQARMAMMYDNNALYIGGDILDPTPLRNPVALNGDVRLAWNGDAVQIRFVAISDNPDAAANDITLWYSMPDKQPGCCIFHGRKGDELEMSPPDVQGAYRLNPDQNGYTFEYRIPWVVLRGTRSPRAGDTAPMHIQYHWGLDDGAGILYGLADVRSESMLPGSDPAVWGRAIFE